MTVRLHVVLLAGGAGTRFWPLSREHRPKPFLRLFGRHSLLRTTRDRARRLAPRDRIWVVAPRALRAGLKSELPELRPDRTILEPSSRGTAAAVGLAARAVSAAEPGALIAVLPTDHLVRDPRAFTRAVRRAAAAASEESAPIVCLGVRPDRPATEYGYLEVGRVERGDGPARVRRFVEKPPPARARAWSRSKRHLWNAGVVVARAERILESLARHAPRIHRAVRDPRAWDAAPVRSFDHAVLEKAGHLAAVPLAGGWADVGSWDAAASAGPARGSGLPVLIGSEGSAVFSDRRVVALVDVPNVVVVDTPDAVLVVARGSAQRVREAVREVVRRRPAAAR